MATPREAGRAALCGVRSVIFVTVGAQMPFDRLICWVDDWARERGRRDVLAQIGPSDRPPTHIAWEQSLSPARYRELVKDAKAIVGHAGMGTIIAATEFAKPLLVVPRLAEAGETRSDHQVATARQFAEAGRVLAAESREACFSGLDRLEKFQPAAEGIQVSPELIQLLRSFAHGVRKRDQ
jgi:UDP-N-acetylglucosamine transferase subunit ALG13